MYALFVVPLAIGLIAIAAAGGLYVYFKHKYKDKRRQPGV